MKMLLRSIPKKLISSILVLTLCFGIAFAGSVPQEDFDEVYNQLVISNNSLKEAVIVAEGLRDTLVKRDLLIKEITSDNVILTNSLIKTKEEAERLEIEKQEAIDELLGRLIISNDQIKADIETIEGLNITIGDLQERLKESNNLLTRNIKHSLGGGIIASTLGLGGEVQYSYFLFKNFSIDAGIGYIDKGYFLASVGLSFCW